MDGAKNRSFGGTAKSDRMPVIFVGHGSPENALGQNEYNSAWAALGKRLPRPRAILCISAHWVIRNGTAVTAGDRPKTIHDFYGFPQELYALEYPAPGSPGDAEYVRQAVRSTKVNLDYEWGLDHGTWSVLLYMYPEADIPVLQLSLNYNHPLELFYSIGKDLASLRDQGFLVMGSGNLVHNLMVLRYGGSPYPWAEEFDRTVKECISSGDHTSLIRLTDIPYASTAHPSTEHYLPLLPVLGAAGSDTPSFFNESIAMGSVSMRGVVFGL